MQATLVEGPSSGSIFVAHADPAKPPSLRRGRQRSFRWAPRDTSRDGRTYVGRPGSKRHQRFLNRSYISSQETFVEHEDFNIHPTSFSSPLDLLFRDPQLQLKWEEFLLSTEEQQDELLIELTSSINLTGSRRYSQENANERSPVQSFIAIDKKIRTILLRHANCEFLYTLEKQIIDFIGQNDKLLMYPFSDPLQRILCHGVCQFYSLPSKSKSQWGRRVVVIENSQHNTTLPAMTLFQYLQRYC